MFSTLVKRLRRWFNPPIPRRASRFKRLRMAWTNHSPWSQLSSLALFDESAIGPIQRDEALLIHGLTRSIRPKMVLEIGFAQGHSARTFLQALDSDATLWSVDNEPYARDLHSRYFASDPRSRFQFCDQTAVDTTKFHVPLDVVLFDGSHDLEANRSTFERIRSHLSSNALILIHDTGIWVPEHMDRSHWDILVEIDHRKGEGGIIHQHGERQFVNWLCSKLPHAQFVHIHSRNTLRHGMTLVYVGDRHLPLGQD